MQVQHIAHYYLFPSGRIELTTIIYAENWEVKGKFPQNLKPMLSQVALKAIILGEYDDNFFNLMPRLFPYNKFTMTVSPVRHVDLHHIKR